MLSKMLALPLRRPQRMEMFIYIPYILQEFKYCFLKRTFMCACSLVYGHISEVQVKMALLVPSMFPLTREMKQPASIITSTDKYRKVTQHNQFYGLNKNIVTA